MHPSTCWPCYPSSSSNPALSSFCSLPAPPRLNNTLAPPDRFLSSPRLPLLPSLPCCPRPPLFSSLIQPFGIKRIRRISSAQWPLEVAFNLKVWQGRQSLKRFTWAADGREKRFLPLPVLRREREVRLKGDDKKREERRNWLYLLNWRLLNAWADERR